MASALTMTAPSSRARRRASADLPLAVGPAIRTARRVPVASPPELVAMPVLCLIANPAEPELDTAIATEVADAVGGELNWLNPDIACEIVEPKSTEALASARAIIGNRPIDAALVPTEGRRKQLLIADMDSTMIEQECIDELADELGIKPQVA